MKPWQILAALSLAVLALSFQAPAARAADAPSPDWNAIDQEAP